MKKILKFDYLILFVLPLAMWCFTFRKFLDGAISINVDTFAEYSMYKFFYNNVFNGTIPMWDPFVNLGAPYISVLFSGVLSPVMFVFALLHFIGVNYYVSFMIFLVCFYVLGLTGFYLLAKEILGDRFYAWLGFLALLFSGLGPMLFNQVYVHFIFCPSVWVFYFLIRFIRTYHPKFFIGIMVALSNMVYFYYPFHFLTVFLMFFILSLCIYPQKVVECLKGSGHFFIAHQKVFWVSLLFLLLSFVPMIFFKVGFNNDDLVFPCRHSIQAPITEAQLNKESSPVMSFGEVSWGGSLGERIRGGRLFSDLGTFDYNSDDFFYIPVFVYLIFPITLLVVFRRTQILILSLMVCIFLLALGQASFLHAWLYQTIFYFKYFRNYFFFMAFLIPLLILLAMLQLKELFITAQDKRFRWQNVTINTFLHIYFLIFLWWQGHILIFTYITVICSCLLTNLLFLKSVYFKILFLGLIFLEPFQVYYCYSQLSANFHYHTTVDHQQPKFSYQRPLLSDDLGHKIFSRQVYGNYWHDADMSDSTGDIKNGAIIASKYSFFLSQTTDPKFFLDYIRPKFYLYDDAAAMSKPMVITNGDGPLTVLNFNPNYVHLRLNLPTKKFLVYTDSFEKYWKAWIDREPTQIFRVNTAFKGVWLPSGIHDVEFRYLIPGEEGICWALFVFNGLFFIFFLRVLCKE